jgi:hypothetical protein
MNEPDYASLEVIQNLPQYFRPHDGDDVPLDLIGATIVHVGTFKEPRIVHGGGLVIDYLPAKGNQVKRVVLASADTGSWVAFQGNRKAVPILVLIPESHEQERT